jgi:hypothetical protein
LTGATNGAGTGYPPGAPVLTPKVLVRFSLTFIHSKVNVSQYEITFSYFHDVVAPIIFPEQPENVRRASELDITLLPCELDITLLPSELDITLLPSELDITLLPSELDITLLPSELDITLLPSE